MRTIKKQISVLLAVLMVLSSIMAVSFSVSAAETTGGTITVNSNLCDSKTYNYTATDKQIQVTYYLQCNNKILNMQGGVYYDSSVLKVADTNTLETSIPKFTSGSSFVNFDLTNKALFNSTSLHLYDFTSKGVFFTVTFDIIGSGNTEVNLDVEVITATTAKSYSELKNASDIDLVYYDNIASDKFAFSSEGKLIGEEPVSSNYYVFGDDFKLKLTTSGVNRVSGIIALQPGTYKFKLDNNGTVMGYGKTFTDKTNGMTFSSKYSSYCTLNATGGVYTFQVDTDKNALVVKHNSNLPNEYLVGDIHTVLTPISGKTYSVGSSYLEAGTYNFKLSIGNVQLGYGTTVNDSTPGSLTFNKNYSKSCTLVATGGTYTFTLDTSNNKLLISCVPAVDEKDDDVHVSGDISMVLNDNNGADDIATGTVELEEGSYSFKIYSYGTGYTLGEAAADNVKKTLSSSYKKSFTLIASGGTYSFSFNKLTGQLIIKKL